MTFEQWLIFAGVWSVVSLPVGPNRVNCISVAAAQGFQASLFAVAGILAGSVWYMTAVALGLAAVLQANAALFTVLKLAGAAYLVWLGLRLLRRGDAGLSLASPPAQPPFAIFRRSLLISLSNPKAVLSYTAIFSQFIDPAAALAPQMAMLVPTVLIIGGSVDVAWCALGVGARRLLGSAQRRRWFDRGVGGFYIATGVALASNEFRKA